MPPQEVEDKDAAGACKLETYEATPTYEVVEATSRQVADAMDCAGCNLLPHVVNGLSLGLLFALIALGFMLIVGVMEVINLAHGSLFALGLYVALFFLTPQLGWFPDLQAGTWRCRSARATLVALLLAPVLVGLFGMLLELCMRRTYGRDPLYGLLLTFGAALVIEELDPRRLGLARAAAAVPEAISGAVLVGDLIYSQVPLLRLRLRGAR